MFLDRDRTHARTSTTMWDAEGLVQIEVADICTAFARLRKADHRIEVRAVKIDLTAGSMDDVANSTDRLLVDAMRRRISDHQGREAVRICVDLEAQVIDIDIASGVAIHGDDFHTRHLSRSGICTVRRCRNKTDRTLHVTPAAMIRANREQTRIFALRTRVWL